MLNFWPFPWSCLSFRFIFSSGIGYLWPSCRRKQWHYFSNFRSHNNTNPMIKLKNVLGCNKLLFCLLQQCINLVLCASLFEKICLVYRCRAIYKFYLKFGMFFFFLGWEKIKRLTNKWKENWSLVVWYLVGFQEAGRLLIFIEYFLYFIFSGITMNVGNECGWLSPRLGLLFYSRDRAAECDGSLMYRLKKKTIIH